MKSFRIFSTFLQTRGRTVKNFRLNSKNYVKRILRAYLCKKLEQHISDYLFVNHEISNSSINDHLDKCVHEDRLKENIISMHYKDKKNIIILFSTMQIYFQFILLDFFKTLKNPHLNLLMFFIISKYYLLYIQFTALD